MSEQPLGMELPENPLLATEETDFLPTEESQKEFKELHGIEEVEEVDELLTSDDFPNEEENDL